MPKRPRTTRRVSRQASLSSTDMAGLMREIAGVGLDVLRDRLPPRLAPVLDVIEQVASQVMSQDNNAAAPQIDPYLLLGVERSTPMAQITKRWRELVQLLHTDKKGDRQMYDLVMAAYRQIQDERK